MGHIMNAPVTRPPGAAHFIDKDHRTRAEQPLHVLAIRWQEKEDTQHEYAHRFPGLEGS